MNFTKKVGLNPAVNIINQGHREDHESHISKKRGTEHNEEREHQNHKQYEEMKHGQHKENKHSAYEQHEEVKHQGHEQHEEMKHGQHEGMKHEVHGPSREKDHGDHHSHMLADFRKKFVVSFILTFPVLLFSPTIHFCGSYPFFKGITEELFEKSPGMMTLITIAISVAYFYSSAVVFGPQGEVFFWELGTRIDVMLLGYWLEMRSVMGASRALEELVKIMPLVAHLKKDDEIVDVGIDQLKMGDKILVKPGEKVPVDRTVVEGTSSINESMLTGESKPVTKKPGNEVIGGYIINPSNSRSPAIPKTRSKNVSLLAPQHNPRY